MRAARRGSGDSCAERVSATSAEEPVRGPAGRMQKTACACLIGLLLSVASPEGADKRNPEQVRLPGRLPGQGGGQPRRCRAVPACSTEGPCEPARPARLPATECRIARPCGGGGAGRRGPRKPPAGGREGTPNSVRVWSRADGGSSRLAPGVHGPVRCDCLTRCRRALARKLGALLSVLSVRTDRRNVGSVQIVVVLAARSPLYTYDSFITICKTAGVASSNPCTAPASA